MSDNHRLNTGEPNVTLHDRLRQRSDGIDPDAEPKLPAWPDDARAMPNELARSALFSVRNHRTPREPRMKAPIFVLGDGVTISYTGVELRAEDDEMVWLQILDYAKPYPLGQWVEFTLYQLCKDLDWPTTGYYYERIHACLLRLKATAVVIQSQRLGIASGKAVSLVQDYEWQGVEGCTLKYRRVVVNPLMQRLFGGRHYTQMEWEKYRGFAPIARRIYDYCASHRDPYPLRVHTLQKMCDSRASPKKWRELVERACAEVTASGLATANLHAELKQIKFNRPSNVFDI